MRRVLFALPCLTPVLCLACAATPGVGADRTAEPATLIVNARLPAHPGADALLLKGDRIAAVGRRDQIESGDATLVDARGGWVLPGFHDGHIHLLSGGRAMTQVPLSQAKTMAEALSSVRAYATAHPEESWILGRGWMYELAPRGTYPTRHDLDGVLADRPVWLRAYDGHSGWANSKALAIAGVGPDTKDPADGTIVREADGKTPSGVLLEGAMELVMSKLPDPPRAAKRASLEAAMQHLLALGVTAIDDIEADEDVLEILGELEREGRLPLRVTMSLPIEGDFAHYEALRRRYDSQLLSFGFVKGFVDGVYESKTALVVEPYPGTTSERGQALIEPEQLYRYVRDAQARGLSVGLHACGDGGVRLALDTFERVAKELPKNGTRHRIEHIEILQPADRRRFAELDVVAAMQPFHSTPSDGGDDFDDNAWARNVGAALLPYAFAWNDVYEARGTLAFGSDWPVMSADPLWGLATALTRQNASGLPKQGWYAHQKLPLEAALAAYSTGAAYGVRKENVLGKLEPGHFADVVVLAPGVDPGAPQTLWAGERVRYTLVGGVVRYAAQDLTATAVR